MTIFDQLVEILTSLGEEEEEILEFFSTQKRVRDISDKEGITRIENWIQLELMYRLAEMYEYNDVDCEYRHTYAKNKMAQSHRSKARSEGLIDIVCRPPSNSTLKRYAAIELKVKRKSSVAIKAALSDLIKVRRFLDSDVTEDGRGYRAVYSVCIYQENDSGTKYPEIIEKLKIKPKPFGSQHFFMIIGWESNPSKDEKVLWSEFKTWVDENIIKEARKKRAPLTH